jgi:glycosyltransferase involved in cell wall biosynthesis
MPHKGAHVAVEAFRGLPPDRARLRIWGDATQDPGYAARLVCDLRGADVKLAGRFPEERKAEVFSEMDVLLVPSTGLESYGIVVDEAMAHGVPVVASRDGALPERFPETCGAFVTPGDAAGLRAWISTGHAAERISGGGARSRRSPRSRNAGSKVYASSSHRGAVFERPLVGLRVLRGSPFRGAPVRLACALEDVPQAALRSSRGSGA